jgi:hypothetical protein
MSEWRWNRKIKKGCLKRASVDEWEPKDLEKHSYLCKCNHSKHVATNMQQRWTIIWLLNEIKWKALEALKVNKRFEIKIKQFWKGDTSTVRNENKNNCTGW